MQNRSIRLGIVGVGLALSGLAAAEPVVLQYSGRLLDGSDQPVRRSVLADFRLYSDATGGSLMWQAPSCPLLVQDGYVSLALGGNPAAGGCGPLLSTDALPPGSPRFLEVRIDGVALSPRLTVGAVPSAVLAQRALEAESLTAAGLGALDARFVRLGMSQTGNVLVSGAVQAGSLQSTSLTTGAVTAGLMSVAGLQSAGDVSVAPGARFLGDGSGLSNVNAATVGGLSLAGLDGRYDARYPLLVGGKVPASALPDTLAGGLRAPTDGNRTSCASSETGSLYFNTVDGQLRVCDGSVWKRVSVQPARLSSLATSVDFGTVRDVEVQRDIVIRNDGELAATSIAVSVPSRYTIVQNSCGTTAVPGSLAGGATCTLKLGLRSSGQVESRNDTVQITSSTPAVTVAVTASVAPLASCQTIRTVNASAASGTYTVEPVTGTSFSVYCDMNADGYGWTLLYANNNQHRNSAEWELGWTTVTETGKNASNPSPATTYLLPVKHWPRFSTVKLDSGLSGSVLLNNFSINPNDNYRWSWTGTGISGVEYQNGYPLSTIDRDNDAWSNSCAQYGKTFGWYRDCCNLCMTTANGAWPGSTNAWSASDWTYRETPTLRFWAR